MQPISQFILFLSYAVLGAVLAYWLPYLLPIVTQGVAWGVGVGWFLTASLIHEVIARRVERQHLQAEIDTARMAQEASDIRLDDAVQRLAQAEHDIERFNREIHGLHGAINELDDEAKSRANGLVAEMRVLQDLLARLDPVKIRANMALGSDSDDSDLVEPPPGLLRPTPATVPDDLGSIEIFELIRKALEENRVDLYLQPIVNLPQRKVLYYEAFSRLRDEQGRIIEPQRYLQIAENAGLINVIDNLLLFRCVQLIRRIQTRNMNVGFFCNLSSRNLEDAAFVPQFIEFLERNEDLAGQLVFEFPASDATRPSLEVAATLNRLTELGFGFSMDQVPSLDIDYRSLAQRNFRFIKVDAPTLLDELHQAGSRIDVSDLAEALAQTGIDLIATKVEDETQVISLLEYQVRYGQGYLFGEPRPSRYD